MADHTHAFGLAYTLKTRDDFVAVEICECGETKRTNNAPDIKKRASNMGGEFSTNWRG